MAAGPGFSKPLWSRGYAGDSGRKQNGWWQPTNKSREEEEQMTVEGFQENKAILSTWFLSQCSIAVKRHSDHRNADLESYLIGVDFQCQRFTPLSRWGAWQADVVLEE